MLSEHVAIGDKVLLTHSSTSDPSTDLLALTRKLSGLRLRTFPLTLHGTLYLKCTHMPVVKRWPIRLVSYSGFPPMTLFCGDEATISGLAHGLSTLYLFIVFSHLYLFHRMTSMLWQPYQSIIPTVQLYMGLSEQRYMQANICDFLNASVLTICRVMLALVGCLNLMRAASPGHWSAVLSTYVHILH